jgi:hypothetical protein
MYYCCIFNLYNSLLDGAIQDVGSHLHLTVIVLTICLP